MNISHENTNSPKHIVVCQYPSLNRIMLFGINLKEFSKDFKEFGGAVGVWNIKHKN